MCRSTPTPRARGRRALAAALILLSLSPASGCGQSVDSRLAEVRALQDAGDFSSSIAPLREILATEPDHEEANYLLGVALVQTRQPTLAIWPLRKASESEEFGLPAGVLLASTLLETQGYEEAVAAADRLLERDPEHVNALLIRIQAEFGLGKQEEALADSERVLAIEPEQFRALASRATALALLGRAAEAEQAWLELEATTRRSGDPSLEMRGCIALATYYQSAASEKAAPTIERCVEKFPAESLVLQLASDYYDSSKQPERATELWRRAVAEKPDNFQLRSALANRLAQAGDMAGAEATLVEAAELFDDAPAWNRLAVFYQNRGELEKALEATEKAARGAPGEGDELRFRKAELLVDLGREAEAEAIAKEIEESVYRDLLQGKIRLRKDDTAGALAAFEAALKRWPNNAPARYLAGLAAERLGEREKALSHYREAVRTDDTATDAALAAAALCFSDGNYVDAVGMGRRQAAKRPFRGAEALVIVARSATALARYEDARAALAELAEHDGQTLTVTVERAALERRASGPATASRVVRESGLDLADPANEVALRSLTLDLITLGRPDEALGLVARGQDGRPDAPSLHDLRARVLVAAGRRTEAREAFERALAVDPDYPPALAALARLAVEDGRTDEALALAERVAEGGDADAAYLATQVLASQGRTDEAMARLRKILEANPSHAASANDLAWHLAERATEGDLALQLAQRATRLEPRAEFFDTLGWVQLKRGDAVAAVASFERALELKADQASVRYRLGLALEALGQPEQALQAFRGALGAGVFPEAEAARARVAKLEATP
jgi:tetratricopeptide (TPR) repeat protein